MSSLHKLLIGVLLLIAAIAGYNLAHILHPPQSAPPMVMPVDSPANPIGLYRPEFTLPDLAGSPHRVGEWEGKVLLINFWATWCAPCREEIPAFIAVRRELGESGFEIIGIAIDQPEFVTEYARDMGIPYPLLYGAEDAMEVSRLYGNHQGTLPYSAFVDAKGRVAHIHRSGVLSETGLRRIVEELLSEAAENEPKRSKLP